MSTACEVDAIDQAVTATVTLDGSGVRFVQERGDTILRSALRSGIGFPYECNAGSCGTCRFELLDGDVDVLWPAAPGWNDRDRRKGRYLGCQTTATSDCRIRVRTVDAATGVPRPARMAAVLVDRERVTHDMVELVCRTDAPAVFLPGQYALVSLGPDRHRCYSMSNLPNGDGQWRFIVRQVAGGAISNELAGAPIGSRLTIDGPLGGAYFRASQPEEVVCVAGGSGLGPMLSIAAAAAQAGRRVHLFYGGRRPRDMACLERLDALAATHPSLTLHTAISSPVDGEDDAWSGARLLLPDLVTERLAAPLEALRFYLAGAPPMIAAFEALLCDTHRLPYERFHFDRFV